VVKGLKGHCGAPKNSPQGVQKQTFGEVGLKKLRPTIVNCVRDVRIKTIETGYSFFKLQSETSGMFFETLCIKAYPFDQTLHLHSNSTDFCARCTPITAGDSVWPIIDLQ